MMTTELSLSELMAPCGINCGVCLGYLREKNKCKGCRSKGTEKPTYCFTCIIANCNHLKNTASGFCYDCDKYPCRRMKQLEKRYRLRYNMSIFENFAIIKSQGLQKFAEAEKIKWLCHVCGGNICIHRGFCLECGKK